MIDALSFHHYCMNYRRHPRTHARAHTHTHTHTHARTTPARCYARRVVMKAWYTATAWRPGTPYMSQLLLKRRSAEGLEYTYPWVPFRFTHVRVCSVSGLVTASSLPLIFFFLTGVFFFSSTAHGLVPGANPPTFYFFLLSRKTKKPLQRR